MSDAPPTIVVGLDGAHWELLDPWIRSGDLPAIERLREQGAWGDLESCLPPVTCPNWKCYATGRNPGKLGAFWWELVDVPNREITTVDATVFDAPELWDYFNARDRSTAVVNMPTTYPPREVDGCMIAGGPDAEAEGYTAPASLQADLEAEYDYRLRPTDVGLLPDEKERIAASVEDLIDVRFDVALDRLDAHDFVHVTVFYINVLQHFFWRDPVVRSAWERIDEHLGRLLETGANVVVMSDHGSNEIDHVFNVNAWLVREGHLVLESGAPTLLSSLGVTTENAKRLLGRLGPGWYSRVKELVPEAVAERIPSDGGGVTRAGKAAMIDWEASTAVAGGQGPVYALTDDEQLRNRLRRDLEAVSHPETGRAPIETAYDVTDVYHGDRMDEAPAIVIDQARGWHVAGDVGTSAVFESPGRWAAENKRTGLFAAHGPAFDGGVADARLDILDLAPTILHLAGLPVSEEMDGVVRTDLFAQGTGPADRDPEVGPDYADRGRTGDGTAGDRRDRLEDLGYL